MITDTTTSVTAREQVPTARVTLGELADFAKVARKASRYRRRRAVRLPLLDTHVLITPTGIVGGTPGGTMVSARARVMAPTLTPTDPRTIAVPLDVIAEAAKSARKLSAIITPGSLNREDGATFTWRDADAEQYADAWSHAHDAFGEPIGAPTLSARFEVAEWGPLVGGIILAASKDESRPVLTGVMMRASEPTRGGSWTQVQCAATDSYRMHVGAALAYVHDATGEPVIIPAEAMALTLGVRGASTVTVDARESDGQRIHLTLRGPGVDDADYILRVSCERVAGQYPNVDALRPQHDRTAIVTLAAEAAADTVKAAAGVARKSQRRGAETVIMYAEGGANALRVSVRESDDAPGGEWQVSAMIEAAAEEVGANGGFVADALRAVSMTATDAVITLHGPQRPMMITQTDADAATAPVGLWCVVMPIRI